jgi:hypothetical protein
MEDKTTMKWWQLLNPLAWFGAVAVLLGSILRFFGQMKSEPPTGPRQKLDVRDVEDAAKLAAEQTAAVKEISKGMTPAEVVYEYARANEDSRMTMNLSALSEEQQDWLLGLSDVDLVLLGGSPLSASAQSLENRMALPLLPKPKTETKAPEILPIPDDEETVDLDWLEARRELF